MSYERSADIDKKLGIDYSLYNSLNMQAQKATLKVAEYHRRVNLSISPSGTDLVKISRLPNIDMKVSLLLASNHFYLQSSSSLLETMQATISKTSTTASIQQLPSQAKKSNFLNLVNTLIVNPYTGTGSSGKNS